VRRWPETGLPPNAARGKEADPVLAEIPPGCLGGISSIGVVGEQADEPAVPSGPDGREEERQQRFGDAGAVRGSRERS
jgi:hypothetical protein